MGASFKLRQLESKISTLQTHHQALLKERSQEIAVLITSLELASLEDNILLGGLLYLRDKITNQDPMTEVWREAGDRFLRRKQATSPCISSNKSHPTKGAAASLPTPQPSESHPQSRKDQDAKPTERTT